MNLDYKIASDEMATAYIALRLQHRIEFVLAKGMDLRRVQIVWAIYPPVVSRSFAGVVYDAEETGVITELQILRIMDTGLIAGARRRGGGDEVYVAFEVWNKLNRDDIDKAAMTAEALALTFPQTETLAAVYGRKISDEDRAYAESKGVAAFLHDSRRWRCCGFVAGSRAGSAGVPARRAALALALYHEGLAGGRHLVRIRIYGILLACLRLASAHPYSSWRDSGYGENRKLGEVKS